MNLSNKSWEDAKVQEKIVNYYVTEHNLKVTALTFNVDTSKSDGTLGILEGNHNRSL